MFFIESLQLPLTPEQAVTHAFETWARAVPAPATTPANTAAIAAVDTKISLIVCPIVVSFIVRRADLSVVRRAAPRDRPAC
ncbi:MAG: hypothetical protein ACKOCT_16145 [Alphaproteobacteria bacterium]